MMLLKLALGMRTFTLYRETSENINYKKKQNLFICNLVLRSPGIKTLL